MKRKIYTLKILIMGGIIFVSTLACGINIPLLTTSEGNTGTDLPPALVDTPPSAKNDPSLPPPVILSGSGDSIVDFDIEALGGVAVAHITGNADSNHFSVSGIDDNGGFVNLLVDTSDPYDGFRPVNFMDYENATRFEVDASGDWSISLFPLSDRYVHSVMIPGSFFGRGDDILLL